jgi:hypothetical protein
MNITAPMSGRKAAAIFPFRFARGVGGAGTEGRFCSGSANFQSLRDGLDFELAQRRGGMSSRQRGSWLRLLCAGRPIRLRPAGFIRPVCPIEARRWKRPPPLRVFDSKSWIGAIRGKLGRFSRNRGFDTSWFKTKPLSWNTSFERLKRASPAQSPLPAKQR